MELKAGLYFRRDEDKFLRIEDAVEDCWAIMDFEIAADDLVEICENGFVKDTFSLKQLSELKRKLKKYGWTIPARADWIALAESINDIRCCDWPVGYGCDVPALEMLLGMDGLYWALDNRRKAFVVSSTSKNKIQFVSDYYSLMNKIRLIKVHNHDYDSEMADKVHSMTN